ncbi:MAG TPA: hypothetical protein VF049_05025 [Nocardioidaceae bacterium]
MTDSTKRPGPSKKNTSDPVVDLAGELADLGADVEALRGELGQLRGEDADNLSLADVRDLAHDLARAVEELVRRPNPHDPDDVGGDLAQLRSAVTSLAEDIENLAAGLAAVDFRPPCWVDLTQEEAREAWRELYEWLRDVLFARYPITEQQVPPCWYLHPAAVEELSWLRTAWCAAYRNPKASPTAAGEWHDRWLPGVLRRIADEWADCGKRGGQHEEWNTKTERNLVDDVEKFQAAYTADVNRRPRAADTLGATGPPGPAE